MDMVTTETSFIEEALDRLDIQYRRLPIKQEAFYFCTLSNGLAFNLRFAVGNIKMWRFIGVLKHFKAGTRVEKYKKEIVIGLEVTDEGDISFYAMQKFECGDFQQEKRLMKMLSDYTRMICRIEVRKSL